MSSPNPFAHPEAIASTRRSTSKPSNGCGHARWKVSASAGQWNCGKRRLKKGLIRSRVFHPAAAARVPAWHFTAVASLDLLRQEWLDAVLAFDGAAADRVIRVAFGIYPVEMVCTEILQVNLSRIGEDWYHEKTTVQQEHFASAVAARRLEILIAAAPSPTPPADHLDRLPAGRTAHIFGLAAQPVPAQAGAACGQPRR